MGTSKRQMLRHFLATLAYRGTKAIKNAPPEYATFSPGCGVRTPVELLAHVSGVLTYAHSHFEHYGTTRFAVADWSTEVDRFYSILGKLEVSLEAGAPLRDAREEQLLQGPFADAMTHVGQLAMLRRLAGSSIPAENFLEADIHSGQVGPDQPDPVSPD